MKKLNFHLIASFILFLLLVGLNFLPKLIAFTPPAKSTDQQSFKKGSGTVLRFTSNGGIITSSEGISSPEIGLSIRHETIVINPSSNTFYINPQLIITTKGFTTDATTFLDGAGVVPASTNPALTNSAPFYPRTLEFFTSNSTGFLVMRGTDSFNRVVTETLNFASGTIIQSKTCWIGISSLTINFTPYSADFPNSSSSTFYVGTSSGYALPYQVSFATDIYRVVWGEQVVSTETLNFNRVLWSPTIITTATINTSNNTVQISSRAFPGGTINGIGTSTSTLKMDIWGVERKSAYAP